MTKLHQNYWEIIRLDKVNKPDVKKSTQEPRIKVKITHII